MIQPLELKALVCNGKLSGMTQVVQEFAKQAILDIGKLQHDKSAHEQAKHNYREPSQEPTYAFFD